MRPYRKRTLSESLSRGMQPPGFVFYDISDGREAVPVLCDDHEAAKSFIYAATCPDADFEGQDFFGCDESYGCSCLDGCSDIDDCACKLLLPGTSINMRECGSECACAANTKGIPCCQNSPVFHGLTCRLAVKKSGSKGLGKRIFCEIWPLKHTSCSSHRCFCVGTN
jgi:hypothetical protein